MSEFSVVTVVVAVALNFISTVAPEVCVPTGNCKCKAGSFTVDLSQLLDGQNPRFTIPNPAQPSMSFYYMPCQPLDSPKVCNDLGKVSVCQMTDLQTSYDLGDVSTEQFFGDPATDSLNVSYAGADGRISHIMLHCSDDTQMKFISEEPVKTYNFQLYTSIVCMGKRSSGLSIGSVLVIIFFVTFALYLVLGILFMKFVRRAQGIEMIPNLEFWKELPLVIRDGFVFTARGCKGETTYEKI